MKIAIIGAGNAGCVTALHYHKYLNDAEIDIYHSPNQHPIEKVGLGTLPAIVDLVSSVFGSSWYDNSIDSTFKTGILYEGWGNKHDKFFHSFQMHLMAMHFVPNKLSKAVLESEHFNAIEKTIKEIEDTMPFSQAFLFQSFSLFFKFIINDLPKTMKIINKNPKVQILLATSNGEKFLREQLD